MKTAALHRYNESLSGDSFVNCEDVPDPKIDHCKIKGRAVLIT